LFKITIFKIVRTKKKKTDNGESGEVKEQGEQPDEGWGAYN